MKVEVVLEPINHKTAFLISVVSTVTPRHFRFGDNNDQRSMQRDVMDSSFKR
jgi:hypothetical protein